MAQGPQADKGDGPQGQEHAARHRPQHKVLDRPEAEHQQTQRPQDHDRDHPDEQATPTPEVQEHRDSQGLARDEDEGEDEQLPRVHAHRETHDGVEGRGGQEMQHRDRPVGVDGLGPGDG